MDTVLVNPARTAAAIDAILRADGCTADEARTVADHLVEASLMGHDSHGIIRILRYHQWLQSGQLRADRPLTVVSDTGALVQCDGGDGMGQWLAREATALGIDRARTHGAAIVALRRAGHIGRLGAYAEQAAAAGFVTVQFCNVAGSRLVAPFGAAQRCMSTAPMAVGFPVPGSAPFVLDFATSLVAEGKALVAAQGGAPLPDDALVDGAGQVTGDPRVLYGDSMTTDVPNPRKGPGALRPMGAHKGSGLALACELLAGALTGNGTNGPQDHRFGNGLLSIVIDPAQLDNLDGIMAEAAEYVGYVRAATPATGTARVLTPGDKERATAAHRRAHGTPLPARMLRPLEQIAGQAGMTDTDLTQKATT